MARRRNFMLIKRLKSVIIISAAVFITYYELHLAAFRQ